MSRYDIRRRALMILMGFVNSASSVILTLLNSMGAPLVSFKATGNSTQAGTPVPVDYITYDILNTGDKVTSSDSDWNTPIVYGKTSWIGTAPSALGVDCYRIPICVYPVNIFDSANLTDDDRTYYDFASITPISTGTRVTAVGASTAPKSRYRLFLIPKSGGTLYVSFNATTTTGKTQSAMIFYKGNYDGSVTTSLKTFSFTFGSGKSTSFTLPYDASQPYLHVMLYPANDGTTVTTGTYTDYTNFQMSFISGAAYEPYHTPHTYNLYLDAPLCAGDTITQNGLLTRTKRKVELDGETYGKMFSLWVASDNCRGKITGISSTAPNIVDAKCTHFPYKTSVDSSIGEEDGFMTVSDGIYIRMFGYGMSTLEDANNYLKEPYAGEGGTSKPVIIEYTLATPTDPEQITMPVIDTFSGTTLIQLETTVQPSALEAEYWSTEEV